MVVSTLQHIYLKIKEWSLLVAMIVGALLHNYTGYLSDTLPYLISLMLLFPYSKLSIRTIRLTPLHLRLGIVQLILVGVTYLVLRGCDRTVMEGVLICVLVPTAASAAVITRMQGGSMTTVVSYCLVGNLAISLIAPLIFVGIGSSISQELPIGTSIWIIFRKIAPMLLLPLLVAVAIKEGAPKLHRTIERKQHISFYLWVAALVIAMGDTTHTLLERPQEELKLALWMGALSLVACVVQFALGRYLGIPYKNRVAGGQALGQKNTIFALWLAHTFVNPLAAIAPATYIIWQNFINAYQFWRYQRTKREF